MDMYAITANMFRPFLNMLSSLAIVVLTILFTTIFTFFSIFFIRYRVNFFNLKLARLRKYKIKFLPYKLLQYLIIDLFRKKRNRFKEYGFTIYVGRQGAGKTISMVSYLMRMRLMHPDCTIVTNFKCRCSDHIMTDWKDFFTIRNGRKGVIFALDEIHSEYNSDSWKDFPETLLSEISQQRKQHIKIVATSQVYKRCAKPIRDQAFSVIVCNTYFNRLVRIKEYDACEYDSCIGSGYILAGKIKALKKTWYVQTDFLRRCYDTYEKIQRMEKTTFLERSKR